VAPSKVTLEGYRQGDVAFGGIVFTDVIWHNWGSARATATANGYFESPGESSSNVTLIAFDLGACGHDRGYRALDLGTFNPTNYFDTCSGKGVGQGWPGYPQPGSTGSTGTTGTSGSTGNTGTGPGGCYPLSNEGTCYEPGEYCRSSDAGMTGQAGNGETIVCTENNGLRWEPSTTYSPTTTLPPPTTTTTAAVITCSLSELGYEANPTCQRLIGRNCDVAGLEQIGRMSYGCTEFTP
jgi:hypothetical protein